MTFSVDFTCLPDVNVWIAIAANRHEHHATARQWFDTVSVPVCFCRITQMLFLRLLTNAKVTGRAASRSGILLACADYGIWNRA
jgi:predicted nucleic acid-binding protein